jgi:hypothetical protein
MRTLPDGNLWPVIVTANAARLMRLTSAATAD